MMMMVIRKPYLLLILLSLSLQSYSVQGANALFEHIAQPTTKPTPKPSQKPTKIPLTSLEANTALQDSNQVNPLKTKFVNHNTVFTGE